VAFKGAPFGETTDGETIDVYTLTDGNGIQVSISNYGGRVVSI